MYPTCGGRLTTALLARLDLRNAGTCVEGYTGSLSGAVAVCYKGSRFLLFGTLRTQQFCRRRERNRDAYLSTDLTPRNPRTRPLARKVLIAVN